MTRRSAGLGGNTGAGIAAGVVVVALIAGAYIAFTDPAAIPSGPAKSDATAVEPNDTVAAAAVPQRDAPAPQIMPASPQFDELRREPDGSTVIAGRAAPLSRVRILLDGSEVATAEADTSGGFAAFALLPAQPQPQVLTLDAELSGTRTASEDEIILAPAAPATAVAADPEERITAARDTRPDSGAAPAPVSPDRSVPETIPSEETPPPAPSAAPATALQTAELDGPRLETAAAVVAPAAGAADARTAPLAILKSDAAGVELLQPPDPQVMSSVALDTIGYSAVGEVQLAGRARSRSGTVRIYLDNRAVASLPVGEDGRWRGELPDIDEGVYTLRVDEVDAGGDVSSRVETPFKRESAATLEAAAQGAAGPARVVTVQKGATLWAIARDRYGDGLMYVRVFEANADNIRDPDLIYPGQVFDLPD